MNDKELEVKMAELTVRSAKAAAIEAKINMEEGYKRLKARMEVRYAALKAAYEHALIDIEEAEASLTNAKYNVDKKFD